MEKFYIEDWYIGMQLKILNKNFTICQIHLISDVDFNDEYCFISKTDDELSLVCSSECAPENTINRKDDWIAFRVDGVLDFSLVGILSKIATALAVENISIFAVSTYNTDYILIKQDQESKAISALENKGYTFSKS